MLALLVLQFLVSGTGELAANLPFPNHIAIAMSLACIKSMEVYWEKRPEPEASRYQWLFIDGYIDRLHRLN